MRVFLDKELYEFVQETEVYREEDGSWTVCCDPDNRVGHVYGCRGSNEIEAKEDAFDYLRDLEMKIEGRLWEEGS